MTSRDISHPRLPPGIAGTWSESLPSLELSLLSTLRPSIVLPFHVRRPAPVISRPTRFYNNIYGSVLAMAAGMGNRDATSHAVGAGDQTTADGANLAPGTAANGTPSAADRKQKAQDQADPDELHNLVVEHGDAIYRLALSVVRDQALAEDVAQEALVKAWLALPTFRGDASLRSWLLRITHNTAISTLRRRRAVVIDPMEMPEQQTKVERSVESRVQGELAMDHFVEALDTLDELSRSIVVLRELEGLSYEEISEVLNVPMPTVKTRLLRARRRLSNVLRDWA